MGHAPPTGLVIDYNPLAAMNVEAVLRGVGERTFARSYAGLPRAADLPAEALRPKSTVAVGSFGSGWWRDGNFVRH
jgi:hypothetical protein